MAGQSSFDIVSKVDLQEVQNAVNNATREIAHRFDFKGAKAEIKLDDKTNKLILACDDAEKMKQLVDVLRQKLVARHVPLRAFTYGRIEPAGGRTVRQEVTMQSGIPSDKAREIVKLIKNTKLKVQAAIQDDQVRVTGKSRDDLQEVIKLLKANDLGIDMQFVNLRTA